MSSFPFGWGGKGNTFILFFANLFKLFFEVFFNCCACCLLGSCLAVTGFSFDAISGLLVVSLSMNLHLNAGAKVTLLFTFQSFFLTFFYPFFYRFVNCLLT
jgi:hypothetical protein